MSKKATDILAYIGPIGLIIALLLGDREASKVHLNQALVLYILEILINIAARVLTRVPLVGSLFDLLDLVVSIALFVLWILGIAAAIRGEDKELPIIGGIKLF